MPDHVFRGDGDRFVGVTAESRLRAADREGRGPGVVAAHFDDDEWIDIFVSNDVSADFLFRNRGGLRFEETAAESGVAASTSGAYMAGMGVARGGLDGDGQLLRRVDHVLPRPGRGPVRRPRDGDRAGGAEPLRAPYKDLPGRTLRRGRS